MSVFSSSVKSQIIDPVFTSESRVEFRLANRAESYMPTLRLGNIGLSVADGVNNTYHFGPGAACVIDRIQLLDGNEELDSLRNVGNWLTFKNSLHTNSQNDNVFKDMVGGQLGWAVGATGELLSNDNKVIRQGGEETLGTLDLREIFGILNSISHLSTSLFPNLRVVIEYHRANDALVNNQTPANVADLKKSVPILIVDEIVDEALAASLDKQLVSASWVAVEHDQSQMAQVPGISLAATQAAASVQSVNLRINGFQNKAVSRVMISKVYQNMQNYLYNVDSGNPTPGTATGIRGLGQYGSKALHKEEFNIRVNGRNVLAGRGVTTPASMAMLCADTWGDLNVCPGAFDESVGLDSKYSLTATQRNGNPLVPVHRPCANWVGVNETNPRILTAGGLPAAGTVIGDAGSTWGTQPTAQQGVWVGNSSWIGVNIQERISDLQLQMTRTGTTSSPRTPATYATDAPTSSVGNFQALDIHVFAEVAKRIDVMGGTYKISYA